MSAGWSPNSDFLCMGLLVYQWHMFLILVNLSIQVQKDVTENSLWDLRTVWEVFCTSIAHTEREFSFAFCPWADKYVKMPILANILINTASYFLSEQKQLRKKVICIIGYVH